MCNNFRIAATIITLPFFCFAFNLSPNSLIIGLNRKDVIAGNSQGILQFIEDHANLLKHSLCILETTGGHEMKLLYSLYSKDIAVHRSDACKIKNFIRSYGNSAKTDCLDAKALAKYGFERQNNLNIFIPPSENNAALFSLVQRKSDLKQTLVAEKNRLKAPNINKIVQSSCVKMIDYLLEQIKNIQDETDRFIKADPILKAKQEILKKIPGIGEIISAELLILLPELGLLNRKQIAALVGVAPIAKDSGKSQGYRRTGHGRNGAKKIIIKIKNIVDQPLELK